MAPRWSNNRSSWGSGLSSFSPLTVVLVVAVFLLTAGAGFLIGRSTGTSASAQVALSAIVEPNVNGMATAEPNEAGAVKAASSLLIGFPALAITPTLNLSEQVGQLVAPNSEPATLGNVNASINNIRTQLLTNTI